MMRSKYFVINYRYPCMLNIYTHECNIRVSFLLSDQVVRHVRISIIYHMKT